MRFATRLLGLGCLATLPALLSGCGFAPLYAQAGLTHNLAQIDIQTPQTRTGYFLEQQLRNNLAEDTSKPKLYTLKVKLTENHYQVGYRVDDTATRSELTDNVSYVLTDSQTGKVLLSDYFTETVTYNASQSPFTGIVSQQDAQERVAASTAEKIQLAVAVYFHDKMPQ